MKRNLRFLLLAMTIVTCLVAAPINDISLQTPSSSSSSSSTSNPGLLYEGRYTAHYSTGMTLWYDVQIYNDYIIVDKKKYTSPTILSNGNKKYELNKATSIYVDNNYNIRECFRAFSETWTDWQKGDMNSQQYQSTSNQQYQYQPQNIYQQPTPTPQPQQRQQKDCSTCNGTGNCRTCNGKGWYTEMGIGGGNHDCPNCNRTGKCRWCNGTGKQK